MKLYLLKNTVFIVAMVYSVAAVAQQATPTPPPTVLSTLDRDWQALNTQQQHVFDDIIALAKENAALKAENDKLRADAVKANAPTSPSK